MSKLNNLLDEIERSSFDGYLINSSDEFLDEFVPENLQRLKWLTGFTGSNGLAIISNKYKVFFTDGRYIAQAKQELETCFKIFNLADISLSKWLQINIKEKFNLAYDAKSFNATEIINIKNFAINKKIKLNLTNQNLIDAIWLRQNNKIKQIEIITDDLSGKNSKSKIKDLNFLSEMSRKEAYFTCDSATINWLLNLRSRDTKFTPLLHSYFLYNQINSYLFIDVAKTSLKLKKYLDQLNIVIIDLREANKLFNICKQNKINIVNLDPNYVSYYFYTKFLENHLVINKITDPLILAKSIKNHKEIEHVKNSHILDGVAKTKFLYWLEQEENQQDLDEIKASEKLLELRKTHKEFLFPSFDTISAYAENGAIIHYKPTNKTNKKFSEANLYLVDSGGQYKYATTDITRTIAFKQKATIEQKRNYTLVLKGHIALARAIFPKNTKGCQLDILARQFLWQDNKDYEHGTGHGIGCFLNVHEGPQSISKSPTSHNIRENMLITNEPGYYLVGQYGIRIENIMLVQENSQNNLFFEVLTLVPMDENLINLEMLTQIEKLWLKNYHQNLYDKLATKLEQNEALWLKNKISFYN